MPLCMARGKLNAQLTVWVSAGTAALEEIVMAVKTRKDLMPVETHIDIGHIVPTSRLVVALIHWA